jgi:short-subunit dehydrogenase
MDAVPAFMKLDAKNVATEAVEATLSGKSYCIPSKRYKFLVFLIKYAPWLINLLSNSLSGGRYKKR